MYTYIEELKLPSLYQIVPILIIFIYWLYVRKFKIYKCFQEFDPKMLESRPRGQCPPFFPNGWFRICNSEDLKVKDVKHINYFGRDIAIFRGTDHQVYGLHAFCAHMGANLGIDGQVKHGQCIQCPFHGWMFDGETGNCIQADILNKKPVNQFEYYDLKKQEQVNGEYLKKCYDGNIKLKRYIMKEINDSILIWLDSRDEYHDKVLFDPLLIEHKLEYRGESINFVNCHIQEIPENGADIRHFDFLHTSVIDYIPFIKFKWTMISERAAEPELKKMMTHPDEVCNDYKMNLINKYITDENKKYINIISLTSYLILFEKYKVFLFNGTGFQVGPGLVFLFLKSRLFEITLAQSVTPISKFCQRVSHKIYTNWYFPYFLSAYCLYGEVKQVMNDMKIWDNKRFGSKLAYNLKTDADKKLLNWRNWFSQFYEGCHEFEKKNEQLDW
jgi:cholesterol 7-desaturase